MEINFPNIRFRVKELAVMFVGGSYDHQIWADPPFDVNSPEIVLSVKHRDLDEKSISKKDGVFTAEFHDVFRDETYVRWGTFHDEKLVVFVSPGSSFLEKILSWYPLRSRGNNTDL